MVAGTKHREGKRCDARLKDRFSSGSLCGGRAAFFWKMESVLEGLCADPGRGVAGNVASGAVKLNELLPSSFEFHLVRPVLVEEWRRTGCATDFLKCGSL